MRHDRRKPDIFTTLLFTLFVSLFFSSAQAGPISQSVSNQGITVSKRVSDEIRDKIITSLQENNPGTFPIFRRFAPGEDSMIPVISNEYKEYYKLLQGKAAGW